MTSLLVAIIVFLLGCLLGRHMPPAIRHRVSEWGPPLLKTVRATPDFFVASRIGIPLAIAMATLYYGQVWVLRRVALGSDSTPFYDPLLITHFGFPLFSAFLVAYSIPYTKVLNYLRSKYINELTEENAEAKHFHKIVIKTVISMAIVAAIGGKPLFEFLVEVAEHVPVFAVDLTITALLGFTGIYLHSYKRRSLISDRPYECSINSVASLFIITLIGTQYWLACHKIIQQNLTLVPASVSSLMNVVLLNDSVRLWLLSVIAVLPFVHFSGKTSDSIFSYRIGFFGLVLVVILAWLVVVLGDQIYLIKVQAELTSRNIYYKEFPHDWQKIAVEHWVYIREAILALMIVWAAIFTTIELWPRKKFILRLENIIDGVTPSMMLERLHEIKIAFDVISETRNWNVSMEIQEIRRHSRKINQLNEHNGIVVMTHPRRIKYLLKRLCREQHRFLLTENLGFDIVIFDEDGPVRNLNGTLVREKTHPKSH